MELHTHKPGMIRPLDDFAARLAAEAIAAAADARNAKALGRLGERGIVDVEMEARKSLAV